MKPEAERRIKNSLVLTAVAKAENIEISDDEYEEELKKMAEAYHMEVDKIKELTGEEQAGQIKEDMKIQKAVELITNAAVEKAD